MDGWIVSGRSSTSARRPQDGPNVHHGLSFDVHKHLFLYSSGVHGVLCSMYLVKIV
jgi:hypothetical protein